MHGSGGSLLELRVDLLEIGRKTLATLLIFVEEVAQHRQQGFVAIGLRMDEPHVLVHPLDDFFVGHPVHSCFLGRGSGAVGLSAPSKDCNTDMQRKNESMDWPSISR